MEQRTPSLRNVAWLWFGIAIAVLVVGFRQAIFLTPTDAAQGDVGRIFYYHVPSAMMGLVFPYVNFVAALAYLYWRRRDPCVPWLRTLLPWLPQRLRLSSSV